MAKPDVTFFINSNDTYAYLHEVTLNMTDVGDPTDEMRFSNNGIEWSPWYLFNTTHSWDMRLYGGGTSYGIKYVFAEFKNADGTTSKTDKIILVQADPTIYFREAPSQRSDSYLVDIPFEGIEHHIIGPEIDLISIEYDVTGNFMGAEKPLSVKESDPNHTGITALLFETSGTDHNIVWDLLEDIPENDFYNTVKVRIKAHYGPMTSEFYVSPQFSITTYPLPADTVKGKKAVAGGTVRLEMYTFDENGDPVDADSLPVLNSVTDPDGVDHLGGAVNMVDGAETGYYYYDFTVPTPAENGQWTSEVEVVINGETKNENILFYVSDASIVLSPLTDNGCIVYGTLYCTNGEPLEGVEVMILHDDLSDPGHFNPTSIGNNPITATTDSNGFFSANVVRNSEVIIYIQKLSYRRRAKIPDSASAKFDEISINMPTPPRDKFGNLIPS
mgnify:CR=1 FL=1